MASFSEKSVTTMLKNLEEELIKYINEKLEKFEKSKNY